MRNGTSFGSTHIQSLLDVRGCLIAERPISLATRKTSGRDGGRYLMARFTNMQITAKKII